MKDDLRSYLRALKQRVDDAEQRGEQVDFNDALAVSAATTSAQARYWLHIGYTDVKEQRDELLAACSEAHALLYHYELRRETNGVEWGEPEALRQEMITKLWDAITKACPELAQKAHGHAI